MNTVITENTSDGEISYNVVSKLIQSRVLFLYDSIDDGAATDIVAALIYLDSINKEPISLYINCEDGDIRSVMMIYDVMQMITSPIQTICLGSAMFSSIILLAAGTPGMRYATKSSFMCLSQLNAEGISYGDMTNAKITFEQLKRDNKKLIDIISKLSGKTIKSVTKDCERKLFLNPLQAKKYGLIDSVINWNKNK